MAAFPSGFPNPRIDGYSDSRQAMVLRSEMDSGPPKLRRRFTAAVKTFDVSYTLTTAQVATLESFFDTDTVGGSVSFTWTHPRTGGSVNARFVEPYRITPEGIHFIASMKLEVLP